MVSVCVWHPEIVALSGQSAKKGDSVLLSGVE